RIMCESASPIGAVAILSRRPFLHPSRTACFSRGSLAIATVSFGGAAIDIAAIHLGWPWPQGQHRQVQGIEQILADPHSSSTILAGDFHAVSWSQPQLQFGAAGQLRLLGNAGSTWLFYGPTNFLRRYTGMPIHHLFV